MGGGKALETQYRQPIAENLYFVLRSCLNLILQFCYGSFGATFRCQNPPRIKFGAGYLALLNSGFGASISTKIAYNKF